MSIEHADLPIAAVQLRRESRWRSEGVHDYRYDRAGQLADQDTAGSRRLVIRAGLSDEISIG